MKKLLTLLLFSFGLNAQTITTNFQNTSICFGDIVSVKNISLNQKVAFEKNESLAKRDFAKTVKIICLGVFEDKLNPTPNFRRIHRKYLVNYEYVKHRFESSVMMKSGIELPVSRRRR